MEFEKVYDVVHASGENWQYERVGCAVKFVQTGKLPSLRVIKTLIKKLNNT
jgi:hypothetical protein